MANYLALVAGKLKEVAALVVSTGAPDAGKVVALDGTGKLDTSVMPAGIGADVAVVEASENLAAGDFVNVYDLTGSARVRKADATSYGKRAHGFVLAAVTSGANATVYFEGSNAQVTGHTTGTVYLSAATAGAATATPPSGSTQIVQVLGVAIGATMINTEIAEPVELA